MGPGADPEPRSAERIPPPRYSHSMVAVGSRVVARTRTEVGLCGVILSEQPGKLLGPRLHVRFDDGSEGWFGRRDNVLLAEGSPEADELLRAYAESLGAPGLDADIAFAKANPGEPRRTIDRLLRHSDAKAVDAMLDLSMVVVTRVSTGGKPNNWLPPTMRALTRFKGDPVPPIVERLRVWYGTAEHRLLCGWVARAFATAPDPRLLAVYRELCEIELDATLMQVRLHAADPTVYEDLAQTRLVERDGRLEFDVGDLDPHAASAVLAAAGDRAGRVAQLNLVRQGRATFGAVDLAAWLCWPDLRKFPRLNLSEGFLGKKGVELLASCEYFADDLAVLDLTGCDIGSGGCGVLGKAKNLASLRELVLDAGDYDKSKWSLRALERLFPKKNGALAGLERLSLRGWDVSEPAAKPILAPERAPALHTVQLSQVTVELR